jgi:hypothetical protein
VAEDSLISNAEWLSDQPDVKIGELEIRITSPISVEHIRPTRMEPAVIDLKLGCAMRRGDA